MVAISAKEFETIRSIVKTEAGIVLGDSKQALVVSRLAGRLRRLGIESFSDYLKYLERADPQGEERTRFINRLTTNKTEFFREEQHFKYLTESLLPELEERAARGGPKKLRIWSAGCSTGEEPYTIAMVVREYFRSRPDGAAWDIKILASDIDTEVLAKADAGIYREELLEQVPQTWVKKYFLRGVGEQAGSAKVRPELRSMIELKQINLIGETWPIGQQVFDIIFCRNVVIYFDRGTQAVLFDRFIDHLAPEGHLFVGHSESLHGITARVKPIRGTMYKKPAGERSEARGEPVLSEARIVVGGVYASAKPTRVRTVLGSCVSVCLYDREARVGGMNHFLLPAGQEDEAASTRYGQHAMEALIRQMIKCGAERRRLVAKIFGGAEVLQAGELSGVAGANIRFTKEYLRDEGIRLLAERVGGTQALEVHFVTHEGRAFVRPVGSS